MTAQQFRLPDVGEGLTEADIVTWFVAVGDEVSVDQPLCEIETAKSLVELPCPYAGTVREILVAEGTNVAVGTPIVVIDSGAAGDGSGGDADDAQPAASDGPIDGAQPAASGGRGKTGNAILVGYGVREASTQRRPRRAAAERPATAVPPTTPAGHAAAAEAGRGAEQPAGEPTGDDSARTRPAPEGAADVPADVPTGRGAPAAPATPAAGPAAGQGAPTAGPGAGEGTPTAGPGAGDGAPTSGPAAGTRATSAASYRSNVGAARAAAQGTLGRAGQGDAAGASSGTGRAAAPGAADTPDAERFGARVLAKPPVRRLAKDLGIDLAAVAGTGPGGIITREDVVAQYQAGTAEKLANYDDDEPWLEGGTVSPDGRRTRVPARSVRRRTAEAVVHAAFTAPHVTEFHTVDVTRTMDLVARLKEDREFRDLHITPLLIVMKALLLAIRRHPEINASWDDETGEIVYKHYVNLGVAAATPRGLVVPNIKDAHRMSLKEIAGELGELTRTARDGRTTPAAMSDGTITVTNVGAFGIDTGTPILNPGEAAILAFGAVNQRPWVHEGELAVRWVTQLALSFDHRLVDGALGSIVLADVAKVLEDPAQALVWG